MEFNASEALKEALQAEQEGFDMYKKAAERTKYKLGKEMFLSLAEDEKSHMRMIEQIARGMGLDAALAHAREGMPSDRIKTVLSDLKDDVSGRLAVCADELEAIKLGMDVENRSIRAYSWNAENADDEAERELFKKLTAEEEQHYQILKNVHQYLENTGEWFLWEEEGLLDGGA